MKTIKYLSYQIYCEKVINKYMLFQIISWVSTYLVWYIVGRQWIVNFRFGSGSVSKKLAWLTDEVMWRRFMVIRFTSRHGPTLSRCTDYPAGPCLVPCPVPCLCPVAWSPWLRSACLRVFRCSILTVCCCWSVPKSSCLAALRAALALSGESCSGILDGEAVSFFLCIPWTIFDAARIGGKRCPVDDSVPALKSIWL